MIVFLRQKILYDHHSSELLGQTHLGSIPIYVFKLFLFIIVQNKFLIKNMFNFSIHSFSNFTTDIEKYICLYFLKQGQKAFFLQCSAVKYLQYSIHRLYLV